MHVKFHAKHREELELSLTPLVDVVLLLVVFFMLSTTFNKESAITVDLPEASPAVRETQKKILEITIDVRGDFYVNQARVVNTHIETLKRAIGAAAGEARDMPLLISADAKTPHQAVVTAMDALGQLGGMTLNRVGTRFV